MLPEVGEIDPVPEIEPDEALRPLLEPRPKDVLVPPYDMPLDVFAVFDAPADAEFDPVPV